MAQLDKPGLEARQTRLTNLIGGLQIERFALHKSRGELSPEEAMTHLSGLEKAISALALARSAIAAGLKRIAEDQTSG